MKYCPYCGASLHDDMAFCPRCGKQFKDGTEESVEVAPVKNPAPEESKSEVSGQKPSPAAIDSGKRGMTNPLPIIIIVVLFVAAVVGGIIYFTQSGDTKPTFDDINLPLVSGEPAETQEDQEDAWSIEKATNSVLYLEVFDNSDNIIATASGFVFSDRTTVVTNYHVIDGAHHIRAYTPTQVNGQSSGLERFYDLNTILAYDEKIDLALLKSAQDMGIPPIPAGNSDAVKQGDQIYAVGYPLGIANTLSDGLVSSRYKDNLGVDMLQITAPISSGSSGGVLLDKSGNAIGVTCASYVDGQNLNLAIPVRYVSNLLSRRSPQALSDFYRSNFPNGLLTIPNESGEELNLSVKNMQGVWKHIFESIIDNERILVTIVIEGNTLVELWEYADGSFAKWEGPAKINSASELKITNTTYTNYDASTGVTETKTWGPTFVCDTIVHLYENMWVSSFDNYYYRQ